VILQVMKKKQNQNHIKKGTESSEETLEDNLPNTKTSQKSPRKKKKEVPIISSVLKGWVVYLYGHLTQSHSTLYDLIESHSGKVVSSLSSRVTHLLTDTQSDSQRKKKLKKLETLGLL